ncbi:YopX family protein [Bacillus haynesii]|uniref:YopX family protein n=1 Tax=Bacillus haynesii TaxID=1925021 RepID=UPI0003ED9AAD|nr:YopX family protein [Bacillus haynesii]EWH19828.1 hypothetical protein M769_0124725 [Bacillus haynesii]
MREIKFRAWNKEKEIMVYENEDDSATYWDGVNSSDVEIVNDRLRHSPISEYIWMQYTGLKDNTDREIYEGDIIHCVHWFFDGNEIEEHFTASVGFRDGSFTLENINSRYYSDYTFEENGKGICWIGDINYCDEDYEIIGNIYQNPNLLEAEE